MSDPSVFLIITDHKTIENTDIDLVTGLSMYSHWGALPAILDTLEACRSHGVKRVDDHAYFTRILARAFTRGDDEELGSGLQPFTIDMEKGLDLFKDQEAKWKLRSVIYSHDQSFIPVIDLTRDTPTLYLLPSDFVYRDVSARTDNYPLTQEGLSAAIDRLTFADYASQRY